MNISLRARKAIFDRLLASAPADSGAPAGPMPAYAAAGTAAPSRAELVESYTHQAKLWRTEVIPCTTADWGQTLVGLVQRKGLKSLLAGRHTWIAGDLARQLSEEQLCWFDEDLFSFKLRLFSEFDAGITTVRSAIADTGSLVLWPDLHEPRSLSLVPPTHIAILRASSIHFDLAGLMRAEAWSQGMPSNALLVSGPSKTADIQRILAFGAHGPRELVVLLVRDDLPVSAS